MTTGSLAEIEQAFQSFVPECTTFGVVCGKNSTMRGRSLNSLERRGKARSWGDSDEDSAAALGNRTSLGRWFLIVLFVTGSVVAAVLVMRSKKSPASGREQTRFEEANFDRTPDLFPSLSNPPVIAASQTTLHGDDEVLGLLVNEETRAYDIGAISYHHVVNDLLGGQHIAVTYCMVCSSGIAFESEVGGRILTFGFHGIWKGVAVLYDHQTNSHWLQISGECIEGPLRGQRLRPIASRHTVWREWLAGHAASTAMEKLPQFEKDYFPRAETLRGLDTLSARFLATMPDIDGRLPHNELCFGVRVNQEAKAYPYSQLAKAPGGVVNDIVGDVPIVVAFDADSQSAVAFGREYEGRILTFRHGSGRNLRDVETGREFDRDGRDQDAVPARGLSGLHAMQSEWYGWSATWPETFIWSAEDAGKKGKTDF
jgi:hypothetical protein